MRQHILGLGFKPQVISGNIFCKYNPLLVISFNFLEIDQFHQPIRRSCLLHPSILWLELSNAAYSPLHPLQHQALHPLTLQSMCSARVPHSFTVLLTNSVESISSAIQWVSLLREHRTYSECYGLTVISLRPRFRLRQYRYWSSIPNWPRG